MDAIFTRRSSFEREVQRASIDSSGVYICKSIVNDLRHGNYICKSEDFHLRPEVVVRELQRGIRVL